MSRGSPISLITRQVTIPSASRTKEPRSAHPEGLVEDPVRHGDCAVRPVVGQQVEAEPLGVGIDPQREHRVAGDGQHPRPTASKRGSWSRMVHSSLVQIRLNARVEHDDGRRAAEIGPAHRLPVLVAGGEVRRGVADPGSGHRRDPLGRTSLLAAQSPTPPPRWSATARR